MAPTSSDKKPGLVLLAEITGVHGIRGDLLVKTYTASPEAIAAYGPLTDETATKRFELRVVRSTGKGVVARLAGVADRTSAEALRGTKLYVARSNLPPTEASEYYHADLVGLRAIADDGATIGDIVAVQNFGAGDLIEMKPASGSPSEFLPFGEKWIGAIDLAAGTIVVRLPPAGDETDDEDDGSASS